MAQASEVTARNQNLRNEAWRKRLVLSRSFKRCAPEAISAGMSQCEYWDKRVNTASEPALNQARRNHRQNYLAWAKSFSLSLTSNEDEALTKVVRAGMCIPCLGRMIFESLVIELIAAYQEMTDLSAPSRSRNFTAELPIGTSHKAIERRDSLRSGAIAELVAYVRKVCGQPYLRELALLLNHGREQNVKFKRASTGFFHFNLITTKFTASMLKQRATTGGYSRAFHKMTQSLPMDKWGDGDFLL
jgi:hypothetical protein